PACAASVAFGAGLSVERPAGPCIAFAYTPGLAPLVIRVHLDSGRGAGSDLERALQAMVHGFLKWIGMDLVHDGFSSLPGLLRPPAAGRRPVRRGGPGFRNLEERWLSCVVAGRDLRGGPAGAPASSAACLAQVAVRYSLRIGDRE